jgi:predicted nuclease of predicted toxin-antitoxin system
VRFLLDQSADARLLPHLTAKGHDVTRIARHYPAGLPDPEVLRIAFDEGRILIANDRDFGELVFVQNQRHSGIILLRLGPSPQLEVTAARVDDVLDRHAGDLHRFIVVTENLVRVRG